MKQLTGLDQLYLSLERGNQWAHLCGLDIYDPASAPGGTVRFKSILAYLASRVEHNATLRRRLAQGPLGVDRPFWIEERSVDLEYHVRHTALPQPSDWRQLCIQVARIHARPLDLSKPLWEAHVIEGLDNIRGLPKGSFAVLTKIHQAAVEGDAGAEMLKVLHGLSPQTLAAAEKRASQRSYTEPTLLRLMAHATAGVALRTIDGTRLAADLYLRALGEAAGWLFQPQKIAAAVRSSGWRGIVGPQTRFNRSLSPHRVVEAVDIPVDRIKAIRQQLPHITTVDLCLGVVAGALMRYLGAKDELPAESLHALIPARLRDGAVENDPRLHSGMVIASLATDTSDPLARLVTIHDNVQAQQRHAGVLDAESWHRVVDVLPMPLAQAMMRAATPTLANVMVSCVRGADVSMYMAGARLLRHIPLPSPYDQLGLNVCAFTCDGHMTMSFASCRSMLPDPAVLALAMRESFNEIERAAVGQVGIGKRRTRSPSPRARQSSTA